MRLRLNAIGFIFAGIMLGGMSPVFAETIEERFRCPAGEVPELGCYNQDGDFISRASPLSAKDARAEKKRVEKAIEAKLAAFTFPQPMMRCENKPAFWQSLVANNESLAKVEAQAKLLGSCLLAETHRNYKLAIDFLAEHDIAHPREGREKIGTNSWDMITLWDRMRANTRICNVRCFNSMNGLFDEIKRAATDKQTPFMNSWSAFRTERLRPAITVATIPTPKGDVPVDEWLDNLTIVLEWRTEGRD